VAGTDKDELPHHVTTALESIMTCHSGTFLGSRIDPIVNAISNRQPPMSGALLGLPRVPKALMLQYTVVRKLNTVATRRLSRTYGFAPMTSSIV
jgi:hypothetical protein